MKRSGIITLLTDFGEADGFAGTMKGVILGNNPRAHVVDISHAIEPQDIDSAAFVLHTSFAYFPQGTVHMVVVDPGVGSDREALMVQAAGHLFVAPDNGVLKYVFDRDENVEVRLIKNSQFFLPEVSATFHGRDIFAPVAAHLSQGLPLDELGPVFHTFVRGKIPHPEVSENKILGTVLHIDRFGNAITNISRDLMSRKSDFSKLRVSAGCATIVGISDCYEEGTTGRPVAVWEVQATWR